MFFMRNIFMYCGVYTTIATIWRLYERKKYGEEKPSEKDTNIALWVALIIWFVLIL